MWTAIWVMNMPWLISNSREINQEYIEIPSNNKYFELEKLDDAMVNMSKYFPKFNFDYATKNIQDWVKLIWQQKLKDSTIGDFVIQKWDLFKNKFPWFNTRDLFYKVDAKWENIAKTIEESIEYIRRFVKMEIVKRQNNLTHKDEQIDISDLVNFIQFNFVTHITYMLEKQYYTQTRNEFMNFYNWIIASWNNERMKAEQNKYWIKNNLRNTAIPENEMNYLKSTMSWFLSYTRESIDSYKQKLLNEIFSWEPKNQKIEVEPRMIKKPYVKVLKKESIVDKVKWTFSNIFSKK